MTEKVLAWFGDPAVKERALILLKEHRARDEITRGTYQDFYSSAGESLVYPVIYGERPEGAVFRGCAIGCTLPPVDQVTLNGPDFNWHDQMTIEYGISCDVAYLIDETFEAQPSFEEAAEFAVAVVEAIPVGADLDGFSCGGVQGRPCSPRCHFHNYFDDNGAQLIEDLRNAPVPTN